MNSVFELSYRLSFIFILSKKKKISPALLQGEDKEMAPEITPLLLTLRHEEAESCSFGITTSFQLNKSQPFQSFGLVKRWWLHKHVLRFVYLYIHFIPAFLFPLWICWLMQNAKPNRHLKKSNISWARDLTPFCWILYKHCWQILKKKWG